MPIQWHEKRPDVDPAPTAHALHFHLAGGHPKRSYSYAVTDSGGEVRSGQCFDFLKRVGLSIRPLFVNAIFIGMPCAIRLKKVLLAMLYSFAQCAAH